MRLAIAEPSLREETGLHHEVDTDRGPVRDAKRRRSTPKSGQVRYSRIKLDVFEGPLEVTHAPRVLRTFLLFTENPVTP